MTSQISQVPSWVKIHFFKLRISTIKTHIDAKNASFLININKLLVFIQNHHFFLDFLIFRNMAPFLRFFFFKKSNLNFVNSYYSLIFKAKITKKSPNLQKCFAISKMHKNEQLSAMLAVSYIFYGNSFYFFISKFTYEPEED